MTQQIIVKARAAGALWLTCIVSGMFGFVATAGLIVRGDAAITAANIVAHESRFRLAFAADLISGVSYLGVTAILYLLLKPAGRTLSVVAAFFGVGGVAIGGIAWIGSLTSLVLLRGGPHLSALTTAQLQAMALLALDLRLQVFSVGMVFFGIQCVLAGCLIARSTFLPHALGVLLAIGGSGYVIISFVSFLAPALGARVGLFVMPIALVGEGSLTVWLLAKGVDARRWDEQAVG